jgi:Mg/Co/Ni transporter MgtE
MGELSKRIEAVREFSYLIRERRTYVLIPLIVAISLILLFTAAAEMPVLIPFFYAVF